MNFSCSQCSFRAQFETALMMHKQLYHEETPDVEDYMAISKAKEKSYTVPRSMQPPVPRAMLHPLHRGKEKAHSGLARSTSSATKLFGKLRAKICRSKTLFPHAEETVDAANVNDLSATSECTSKALQGATASRSTTCVDAPKESFRCHLCEFEADRITVLDRHLLNHHKIGLENLLKLVMDKTQEGLADDEIPNIFGGRRPYYRALDDMLDEAEFVIETITPKIKILKHASANTDIKWNEIPNLKDNCRIITNELDKFMKFPIEKIEKNELMDKVQSLNKIMCKFVDSSNTLKKVLTKELVHNNRKDLHEPSFDLALGDQESSREWQRAHSEKMDRDTNNYGEQSRTDNLDVKPKCQNHLNDDVMVIAGPSKVTGTQTEGRTAIVRHLNDLFPSTSTSSNSSSS